MDAFFASVEQRDDPSLKGKPVVVGSKGKRSVVAAASYEARDFGVYSAMPMSIALQKCPHLEVVPHRFHVYREVSDQIRQIFAQFTDLIEPLSLDEAYLDVTENKLALPVATDIAKLIKEQVVAKTGLTCTAGISINKFLAKVASGMNKPDGLTIIKPHQVALFVAELPIEKFYGVGAATGRRLREMGVEKGSDLQEYDEVELAQRFGKFGRYLFRVCRGIDDREVRSERVRKSMSVERTFADDISSTEEILQIMTRLVDSLHKALLKKDIKGRTIQIKWRYPDFSTYTRSRSFQAYIDDKDLIYEVSTSLLLEHAEIDQGIRLLGVGLSNLDTEEQQDQMQLDL